MSKNAKRQLKSLHKEVQGKKAVKKAASPYPVLSVEERLQSMITGLLGGPRGDPDRHHTLAAAHCVLLLEQNKTPYQTHGDDDTMRTLQGANVYEVDFLELARKDESL